MIEKQLFKDSWSSHGHSSWEGPTSFNTGQMLPVLLILTVKTISKKLFFHFYHLLLKNLSVPLSYETPKPVCQRPTLLSAAVNDYCLYILEPDWFCKSSCQLGCIWDPQKAVTLEKCVEMFPGRVFREWGWILQGRSHILQRLGYWDIWGKSGSALTCSSKLHVTSTCLLMWPLPFLSSTETSCFAFPHELKTPGSHQDSHRPSVLDWDFWRLQLQGLNTYPDFKCFAKFVVLLPGIYCVSKFPS